MIILSWRCGWEHRECSLNQLESPASLTLGSRFTTFCSENQVAAAKTHFGGLPSDVLSEEHITRRSNNLLKKEQAAPAATVKLPGLVEPTLTLDGKIVFCATPV